MDVDYDDDLQEEAATKTSRRVKGRGGADDGRYAGKSGMFEKMAYEEDDEGPARSIEGWVIIVSGVHEEAQEDDVFEAFAEFGDIKNLHLNLDRRTGFVKGYSFIEGTKKNCRMFSKNKKTKSKSGVMSGKRNCHPQKGKYTM